MAGPNDFTGQNIQDTYQRVLQISSSGQITDGTGSLVSLTAATASHALFAVSASHEITFELSSSYAQTASMASSDFIVQGDITTSGNISASDTVLSDSSLIVNRQYFGAFGGSNIHFVKAINNLALINGGLATSEITASGNISASGNLIASGDIIADNGVISSRLGVGTTSPGQVLEVVGNISASGKLIGNIDGGSF